LVSCVPVIGGTIHEITQNGRPTAFLLRVLSWIVLPGRAASSQIGNNNVSLFFFGVSTNFSGTSAAHDLRHGLHKEIADRNFV
jgi:hypothetical protein